MEFDEGMSMSDGEGDSCGESISSIQEGEGPDDEGDEQQPEEGEVDIKEMLATRDQLSYMFQRKVMDEATYQRLSGSNQ